MARRKSKKPARINLDFDQETAEKFNELAEKRGTDRKKMLQSHCRNLLSKK